MSSKIKFMNVNQSSFYATTRQRVDSYFKKSGISKAANGAMWAKTVFFLSGFLLFYGLILSGHFSTGTMALFAGLVGAFSAFIGFNICHDAIHGAYSENSRVNAAFSLLFHFIGANPYIWSISHNIVHHSYPNIPGHDEDIDVAPGLIRLSVAERVSRIQRYQHLYAFALYGLASLNWVFKKDYLKFFQKKIGQHPTDHHPRYEYFNLFFFKAVYYFLFIVLPLLVLPLAWWQVVAGFLILHGVMGLAAGLVFQLAHVVEGTAFPLPDAEGRLEDAWAEHQLRTTANFARRCAFTGFFCGGLNFQIEHHLFPKICHIHYPVIARIVQQTALEFNLPYIENPTFFAALRSHYRMLRKLGCEAYRQQAAAWTAADGEYKPVKPTA